MRKGPASFSEILQLDIVALYFEEALCKKFKEPVPRLRERFLRILTLIPHLTTNCPSFEIQVHPVLVVRYTGALASACRMAVTDDCEGFVDIKLPCVKILKVLPKTSLLLPPIETELGGTSFRCFLKSYSRGWMMDDGECSGSKLGSTDVRREMDDLRVRWISHGRFLSSHEVTGKLSSVHERRCRWEILPLGRFISAYSK